MRAARSPLVLVLALAACAAPRLASDREDAGLLVLMGGGRWPAAALALLAEEAGGADGRAVIVPYASEIPVEVGEAMRARLDSAGVGHAVVALGAPDADSTLALLDGATAVVFTGGDQRRLVARLRGTRFLEEVRTLHAAGAVVTGTSAGTAALSTRMLTGDPRGPVPDPDRPFDAVRAGRVETVEGFAFVGWAILDQHFLARARHNRLLSLVLEHPAVLGVGIDEATALVVEGGTARVVGEGAVSVYDARRARNLGTDADGDFHAEGVVLHLLTHGQRLDVRTGRVLR
ncbi:MAG TPA: cyanophycinase [Rubricoccaceae bacterium]|nr:cyanophycinase [Rubricoccaceae bacterium]